MTLEQYFIQGMIVLIVYFDCSVNLVIFHNGMPFCPLRGADCFRIHTGWSEALNTSDSVILSVGDEEVKSLSRV